MSLVVLRGPGCFRVLVRGQYIKLNTEWKISVHINTVSSSSLHTPHHAVHYDLRQYRILSYFYGFLDQKLYRKLLLETQECIYFVVFTLNINYLMRFTFIQQW